MKISRILLSFLLLIIFCSCRGSKNNHHIPERDLSYNAINASLNDKDLSRLVSIAESWLGVPYKYGGNDRNGVDCSGMVAQVFLEAFNIKLPRTSIQQSEYCQSIAKNDIREGDLVFFATGSDPERISHVGIMLDEDRFIHSSTSKGVVVSHLSKPYYQRTFRKSGRIITNN